MPQDRSPLGIEALPTIARTAGISTANVYVYFESKLDILFAVYTPWLEDRLDRLFLRSLDERTRIYDDDFGFRGRLGDRVTVLREHSEHDLGVDEIFRATEADEGVAAFGWA